MEKRSKEENKEIAKKYDNWAPFDINLSSEYPESQNAVNAIFNELKTVKGFKGYETIIKRQIKAVLLDLYSKWLTDPEMYTGYNRRSNWYSKLNRRYNKQKISRKMVEIVDAMIFKG